jgi:hypothetical protein
MTKEINKKKFTKIKVSLIKKDSIVPSNPYLIEPGKGLPKDVLIFEVVVT